jgi:hypothetical protein
VVQVPPHSVVQAHLPNWPRALRRPFFVKLPGMFYSVFMADMMPKQVITLHHFDANSEDPAENFLRYFIPPIM